MIDMSHGNSTKQHKKQIEVCKNISEQLKQNETRITGVMIESNLIEGNQSDKNKKNFVYGQSITDACIGWDETESLINEISQVIDKRK